MKNLKKIIAIFLILVLCFTDVALAKKKKSSEDLSFPTYIKVGVYYGSSAPTSLSLYCEDGFNVYNVYTDEDGVDEFEFEKYLDDTTLNISIDSEYISEGEQKIYLSANENIDERIVDVIVGNSTKTYRDGYLLYQNGGAIRVVNYVTLEHYAWGSINREMSYGRPTDALRAQAIAIRTYALKEHHNGFNVCCTTDCLVYGSTKGAVPYENEISTQACRDTEGLVMIYDNEPIDAYFSAASGGGYTMSLYDAWGLDDVPYLKSVADPYTPIHDWKTTYTFDEIRTRIQNYYKEDLGNIKSFEITDTNSFGAVTQICVKGSKGTKIIPRSQIMNVFNLKSTFFCIGSSEYKDITKNEQDGVISGAYNLDSNVYVVSAEGKTKVSSDELYIFNGKTTAKYQQFSNSSYSMENDICKDGYVYMHGFGYGHGIGMSQTGAYAMATAGYSYTDILKLYYQGVDIVDAKDVF